MDEKQVRDSFKIYKYDSSKDWSERDTNAASRTCTSGAAAH